MYRTHIIVSISLSLLCACQPGYEQIRGVTMGTYYQVNYRHERSCAITREALEERLLAINGVLSTYDADSEISRFNRADADLEFQVSDELWQVTKAAEQVWRESQGAFDPTVGPLVELWGFGAQDRDAPPTTIQMQEVAQVIGMDKLTMSGHAFKKSVAGLMLDLSAIAKGFAVDELSLLLRRGACAHFMVDIGGEIRTAGDNPQGLDWRIGIESPDPAGSGISQLVIRLPALSVATSGDYRNFTVVDGQRVDHVMDPRVVAPADNTLVSATVLHESAMWADAYATAAMVLGVEQALSFAQRIQVPMLLMSRANSGAQVAINYNQRMHRYLLTDS